MEVDDHKVDGFQNAEVIPVTTVTNHEILERLEVEAKLLRQEQH